MCHQPSQLLTTLYGKFLITEPLLLELLNCASMQRLHKINQYGVDAYVSSEKRFTRYDHSVGVFCLLRKFGIPLVEQVAGLLHDVSHTVFSHVGDFVFNHHSATASYQDDIHEWYINQTEIPAILHRYGLTVAMILHKKGTFKALEQDLPDLCADRLDYALYGGVLDGIIAPHEIPSILDAIRYEHEQWYFTDERIAKKVGFLFLHLTEHHFAAPENILNYVLAGKALQRALSIGLISKDDIHFSTDDVMWKRLLSSTDATLMKLMQQLCAQEKLIVVDATHYDFFLTSKFRGIDPLILINSALVRLTECDEEFKREYLRIKDLIQQGWYVALL